MSDQQGNTQGNSRSSDLAWRDEQQVIGTCQDPQTVVLAPLIKIFVDFEDKKIMVTQNGEPLANAQAPASVRDLTIELRPMCSIPIPGRDPEGQG